MNVSEYKEKMFDIMHDFPKKHRGAKYIREWDRHWSEKQYYLDKIDWSNKKTALDIGTGVGMTCFQLQQKGIHAEATDIKEAIYNEPLFTRCCNLIKLKRYELYIENNKPTNWPGKYDILLAQRTEFDRESLKPGTHFNWDFFCEDAFQYFNEIYIKCNHSGKNGPLTSAGLGPFWFNPRITEGLGKPYRAWYFHITKEQWLNTLR